MWLDFSDSFPLQGSVGNLDQIFGAGLWYPTEAFLLIASVLVFVFFGKSLFDLGMEDRADGISPRALSLAKSLKTLALFLLYAVLLVLVDIDDILKVLGIQSSLRLSVLSPGYWLPIEVIYPVASIAVFILFGKACYEIGRYK